MIMDLDKYRIVESSKNRFYVQELVVTNITTGILWWKKKLVISDWYNLDAGRFLIRAPFIYLSPPPPSPILKTKYFDSFDEAKEWILSFDEMDKYPKYHRLLKTNLNK